jgi:uncharacterized protein YbjT (DUF2867 family)
VHSGRKKRAYITFYILQGITKSFIMDSRTAIVFGSTGMTGRSLVEQLCASEDYSTVKIFVRRSGSVSGPDKIKEFVTDFENLNAFADQITGDDLYIALGTTIRKAGSVSKMEEIDRDLPVRIASVASANRVPRIAVMSSIGADPSSGNYYLRIKGEMEKAIMGLNFRTIAIVRPSLLLGRRTEKRFGEDISKAFMKVFGLILVGKFRKYRAIDCKDVARAMIAILRDKTGKEIWESDKLQKLSDNVL